MRIRSASWLFASQLFGRLVALPTSILVARALGPDGKGVLALLQLTTTMIVTFAGLGLGSGALYYAGRKDAAGRDGVALAAGYGVLLSAILLASYPLVKSWLAADVLHLSQAELLLVAFALVAPALVVNVVYSFVIGFGSVRAATMVVNISLGSQLVVYGTLFLLGKLTLPVAVVIWTVATLLEATAYSALAWKHVPEAAVGPIGLFKKMSRYSIVLWTSSLVGFAALRVDMFFLGYFSGSKDVGIYSTAVTFAELLWFLPSALNAIMLPKVAGEGKHALDVFLRIQRVIMPLTMLAGVAVFAAASVAVPFLYGKEFAGAILPLALLLPGITMMAGATVPTVWMAGSGKPIEQTKASFLNLVANLIANALLVPALGAAGAALSSTISYSVGAMYITRSFLRDTNTTFSEAFIPRADEARDLIRAMISVLKRES